MNSWLSCGVPSEWPVPPMINAVAVSKTSGAIAWVPIKATVEASDSTTTADERTNRRTGTPPTHR
ncbi:hypothetical protein OKHIL_65980 [Mycolicibacterium mageritense]